MSDRRWVQTGGLAGLVYVVASIVGVSIEGSQPNVNASVTTIASYVNGHRHAIIVASIVTVSAFMLVLWWLGTVHHALRQRDDAHDPLASVVLASGVSAAMFGVLGSAPQAILAMLAGQPGGLGGSTVTALWDFQYVTFGISQLLLFGLVFSFGVAFVHRGIVGSWFRWFTTADALALGIGGGSALAVGNNSAMLIFGWAGLIAFGLIIIASSVVMLARTVEEPATAGALIPGHAA